MRIIARSPRCPRCNTLPKFVVGTQAFCGSPGEVCKVLTWNLLDDPAEFEATAVTVDLGGLEHVVPPGIEIREWGT